MPHQDFPILALVEPSLGLGEQILAKEAGCDSASLKGHALIFLARATRSIRSVQHLFNAGFASDAQSVGRTIIELAIDLAYIYNEDTENRLAQFFGYEDVKTWHYILAWEEWQERQWAPETRSIAEERYNSVRQMYPDERSWASSGGKKVSLRKRAQSVGLNGLYEMSYAEGCAASHSGPQTLRDAYSFDDDKKVINVVSRAVAPRSGHVMWTALFCYLLIIDTIRQSFQLTHYDTAVLDIQEKLRAMP